MTWIQRSGRALGILASTVLVLQVLFLSHGYSGFVAPFPWPVAAIAAVCCTVTTVSRRSPHNVMTSGSAGGWSTAISAVSPGLAAAVAALPTCLLAWFIDMDVQDPQPSVVVLKTAASTLLSFRLTWLALAAAGFTVFRHIARWSASAAVPRSHWASRGLWFYWPVFVWGIQSLGRSSLAMVVDLVRFQPVSWWLVVENTVLPPFATGLIVLGIVIGLCSLLQHRAAVHLGLPSGFMVAVPLPALAAIAGVVLCQLAQASCMLFRTFNF